MRRWIIAFCLFPGLVLAQGEHDGLRPPARDDALPRTQWEHRGDAPLWTRAVLSALRGHGAALTRVVPRDIDTWCPAYTSADAQQRAQFWVGFLSALAKYESTWRPEAVGGRNQWYGLLQILPATARGYGCRAGSGAALQHGPSNLSCAVRILAVTVPRDRAIALRDSRWRGVAADWAPMRSATKRRDMARWLRGQSYCKPLSATRPRLRPF
ncbi:lytic transglycosylase domain-containing protein [Lutimaribacter sp. EGI FJ00015]|uniref:Lytic transglycosylase domain-containing protein n=2 Tax=Lutimaribacter degradans TaxID=2945989 RepID=A0ACC5ZR95_9RHOB|nr:transglycosylase SLT domain-containing protein [Lutimaribacter sp. EGI FJ00013]MCM2560801.1 lytic transglycosylase domain-containing protein [Lutimaribacter sp. EGI FJ00013]MCO0612253.1 lytic transglycosylase domain-containing protein [Lutimaribacter sp. EGI FJ00015]MCO0634626.1 lytic transglycosylase domain-containing protein [Lutimaribacter sp. EGI FJ00014]